jgi:anaerobic magnesium-protoporphyrin IX monomethyl ester cyclase
MKILLVVKSKAIETLGPMYLSAIANKAGHECKITDIADAPLVATVWYPDLIGYSIMTGDREKFKALNEEIKKSICVTSVVGGPDVTFFPQGYAWADHVVQGEAENWLAEFLGAEVSYPDLDSIPWPDRSGFPDMLIRDFIASRGCTNSCAYCYQSAWNEMYPALAKIRYRSAKDVVNEVASVQPRFAYFQDSTFGVSLKWLREFCKEYGRAVRIPFHVHLRPNMVTQERVILLADAGCVSVKIALETASSRLRKLINRGRSSNEDVYIAARLLKKEGIALILQNILALPSATIEDDLDTLETNIKARPAYAWVSIFQPYPKTALADYCEKERLYGGDYSEIADNFFEGSVLNLTDEHKEQVACLQRIFAFAVEMQVMPTIADLTWKRLPKFVHNAMRRVGDKRMLPGIL